MVGNSAQLPLSFFLRTKQQGSLRAWPVAFSPFRWEGWWDGILLGICFHIADGLGYADWALWAWLLLFTVSRSEWAAISRKSCPYGEASWEPGSSLWLLSVMVHLDQKALLYRVGSMECAPSHRLGKRAVSQSLFEALASGCSFLSKCQIHKVTETKKKFLTKAGYRVQKTFSSLYF